jgi:N-acetylglucosamine-6-phosphate deacetylase
MEDAERAVGAGASCITHAMNAMPPVSARNPGLLGLAMRHGVFTEVIPNPELVHATVVEMMCRLVDPDRILAVSDCLSAHCFPGQRHSLSRLSFERDRTLMGGASLLPSLVPNLKDPLRGSVTDLIKVTSQNALRFLGRRPSWPPRPGLRLEVLILDDRWNVTPVSSGDRGAAVSAPGP